MLGKGIDVSQHHGIIDWDEVEPQINFAILRLGWIGNNSCEIDTQFERNYAECKRLNIPVGIYVYNYCKNNETAINGANWVIEQLQERELELPVYIDMEDDSIKIIGKDALTEIVIDFNTVIEQNGYKAGIYCNLNWWKNYLHYEILQEKYDIWIAHFGADIDSYADKCNILQYSETGRINGINGNDVDLDFCYYDLEENKPDLQYQAHIQDIGWTEWQDAGTVEGTVGEGKRIEAVKFKTNNELDIQYRVHCENIGWTEWKKPEEIAGTTGQSLRLEAIEIKSNKILEAQEHIEQVGWMPVSTGNEINIGTVGKGLRLEAFRILVK